MKAIAKSLLISLLALPAFVSAVETFDKLPEVISNRMPKVAQAADGEVALTIRINENGYVTTAEVKNASDPELASACLQAVRSWRYSPAIRQGQAVAATFVQPFRFGGDTFVSEDVSKNPEAINRVSPEVPEPLKHITGTVVLAVSLDAEGKVTRANVKESTHEELNSITTAAIHDWSFRPAVKSGKPVASTVYIPFRYVGKSLEVSSPTVAENRDLRVIRQPMPEIPDELATLGGKAQISFTVDTYGYVTDAQVQSTDEPRLAAIAREAVLNWKFKPVVRDGKSQATRVVQPFNFGERSLVAQAVDKMPKATRVVSPELPASLRGVQGRVEVLFDLKDSGEIASVEVRDSTQPEINTPILEAARKWTFSPAVKDGKAVGSKVLVPFLVGSE